MRDIYATYHRLVYRIANSYLKNDAEAEEVVQTVFLDIFKGIEQFDPSISSFKSWLLQFAHHRSLNHLEHLRSHKLKTTYAGVPLEAVAAPFAPGISAENRILIKQCLAALNPVARRVIEFTYFDGLTTEEIAHKLGITKAQVNHRLYRGMDQIRLNLKCSTPRKRAKKAGNGAPSIAFARATND